MGYSKNGQITNFWPDDTADTLYIENSISMPEIMERIKEKWGDVNMEDITISSEYIHTECLYYDRYDPCDYTQFVVITKK